MFLKFFSVKEINGFSISDLLCRLCLISVGAGIVSCSVLDTHCIKHNNTYIYTYAQLFKIRQHGP